MSVTMYISFPRQLSLDNDYHGIQVVLIYIFLLTHIKIHIILKNKFLMIKSKYKITKSLDWTPLLEQLSVLLPAMNIYIKVTIPNTLK